MSIKNPRIGANNWRVACVLLSRDIKKRGFSISMKSEEAKTLPESVLIDMIDADPVETGNDIADTIIHNVRTAHQKNPESTKLWRGDIEACYAKVKKLVYVHFRMALVKDPSLFGWDEGEWYDTASGRGDVPLSTMDCNILYEAFRCKTEKDAGYLYQRIKFVIDPNVVEGIARIPLCEYEFKH